MSLSNCQVRRATVDDLAMLRRLWQQQHHPSAALEKRLREFQVVETASGDLLGCIALQADQQQGGIHSEYYLDPASAPELRPRLWERILTMARNLGLHRLWVPQGASPFWLEQGFEAPSQDLVQKLPVSFTAEAGQHWLTLRLREEAASNLSLDQEFAVFQQAQAVEGERVLRQARALRWVAAAIVSGVLVLIGAATWFSLRHWHQLHPR